MIEWTEKKKFKLNVMKSCPKSDPEPHPAQHPKSKTNFWEQDRTQVNQTT